MFNRKEQLKHSDFGVTKSNYTVFMIWFDSNLKSLHTKSIETKVKQTVNKPLTNLNRHSTSGSGDLTKNIYIAGS